jgi:hypothetical protein
MVLVVLMSSHIIEEHEFRRTIAGIHHISSLRVGGNTDVQPADSFYLSQRSKSIQKLDQVFLGVSVFQPKDDVVNQWSSVVLFHIPPGRRHPRLKQPCPLQCRLTSDLILKTVALISAPIAPSDQEAQLSHALFPPIIRARVRGALPRNAPGQGRPPRYLLSDLLRCGLCDASFTLADARAYACASFVNGAACSNHLRVARTFVELRLLASVKADLRDPEIVAEVERRLMRALAARKPKTDSKPRVAELRGEIDNLTDAIASGLMKASPALARRLAAAEDELERLQARQLVKAPIVGRIVPNVAEMHLAIVDKLEERLGRDVAHSRAALTEAIGERVVLRPDESGRFLWAEYGLDGSRLLAALGMPEIMVAGERSLNIRLPLVA